MTMNSLDHPDDFLALELFERLLLARRRRNGPESAKLRRELLKATGLVVRPALESIYPRHSEPDELVPRQ